MAHPWHDVALPDDFSKSFPVVVEISQGSKNKYELDNETGLLKVDRVLFSAVHYPANYGFVPRTLELDGDPVDVLVLGQEPIVPLALVEARAIGGFEMRDEHGVDTKVIAVHVNDPAVRDYQTLDDLPPHIVAEMRRFFEDYKVLEGKPVAVGGDLSREQAIEVLRRAARRYRDEKR
jgi:inorganic pyrophosphatase